MLGALAARFGLQLSLASLKPVLLAALVALGGLGAWRAIARFDAILASADHRGYERGLAEFRAAIAQANVEIARARADQVAAAAAASSAAEEKIGALRLQLSDMEKANATLQGGNACGLDAGRVRLLDPAARPAGR